MKLHFSAPQNSCSVIGIITPISDHSMRDTKPELAVSAQLASWYIHLYLPLASGVKNARVLGNDYC